MVRSIRLASGVEPRLKSNPTVTSSQQQPATPPGRVILGQTRRHVKWPDTVDRPRRATFADGGVISFDVVTRGQARGNPHPSLRRHATMRKIKLSIEGLRVESFATAATEQEKGTILGN